MVLVKQIPRPFSPGVLLLKRRSKLRLFDRMLHITDQISTKEYKKCYKILNVPENSDKGVIRHAYIQLVKHYHPDSSSGEADANKFQEIDRAFRILMEKKVDERSPVPENAETEIPHHAVPQHRNFLGFDGIGYGTIFQREKQYSHSRAMKASETVMKHRIDKAVLDDKSLVARQKHDIKTKYGFDRLVEDLIQEAMSKGQFDNLSGTGKPLSKNKQEAPHVDFVTHKINEILIKNGFTPEWITLQKEIRDGIKFIRDTLYQRRKAFPKYPLKEKQMSLWQNVVDQHKKIIDDINHKIHKYNLLVPMISRQMFLFNIEKEAQKILIEGKSDELVEEQEKVTNENEEFGFFNYFKTWFKI